MVLLSKLPNYRLQWSRASLLQNKLKIMEKKIKIYRCPKDCSVGDTGDRCKRCGSWKLYAGEKTVEEIEKYDQELTKSQV